MYICVYVHLYVLVGFLSRCLGVQGFGFGFVVFRVQGYGLSGGF